jgi:hypothetical protein
MGREVLIQPIDARGNARWGKIVHHFRYSALSMLLYGTFARQAAVSGLGVTSGRAGAAVSPTMGNGWGG